MVLDVFPSGTDQRYGAGHWKDIKAFEFMVAELGCELLKTEFAEGQEMAVLELCKKDVSDVIVHYSFWPDLMKRIRDAFPSVRIHLRTVNAEALQHWQREGVGVSLRYRNVRAIYGAARLLLRDARCARLADCLLGISEWDDAHYWRFIPGRASMRAAPYHSPWQSLRPQVGPRRWGDRRNAIVCLAGGDDGIGESQVRMFDELANGMVGNRLLEGWAFELSPGILSQRKQGTEDSSVTLLPCLEEPWDLLCSVKALALLTPLGFGMKTTIVDALAAGCHVLVHPILHRRLPRVVAERCQPVDPTDTRELSYIAHRVQMEPARSEVNEHLRNESMNALTACLEASSSGRRPHSQPWQS